MNSKLTIRFSVVLALAALLVSTLTAWAYPAESPGLAPAAQPLSSRSCSEVLANAELVAANIDLPAHRAEYAALDKIGNCMRVAGMRMSIPVTGRAAWTTNRFLAFKDRQALQRMDP
jgi:hypothetical protein